MQLERIKEIERSLLNDWGMYSGELTLNEIREVVNSLKEGQVWYERFNKLESTIKRTIQVGFFQHYSISDIGNIIETTKDLFPLPKALQPKKPEIPKELSDIVDQAAWGYVKKMILKIFDKVDEALENE